MTTPTMCKSHVLRFILDPYQYDRHIMEPPAPNMDDNLKFHCYEAHIPYTMQFFKDWNLAGMSYIHISKGKIRGKLADKFINTRSHKIITSNEEETSHSVFLRSNTPKCFQWDEEKRGEEKQFSVMIPLQQPSSQESASTATFSFMNYFEPPKKGTSCDVEIDCTVNDLRNIETVMKSLPSEQEESDRISWRAVPSLQEIWKQERRRMAKLLQPEHDFLSHPPPTSSSSTSKENSQEMNKFHKKKEIKPPPFTLDVKKDAARPGARMAAKGMWSLVGVTYGLKEDFLRSLKQIIDRHKLAIQKVDEKLLQADTTATTLIGVSAQADGKQLQLTPTLNEAIDALGSLATTPTLNEAICALDSLAAGGEAEERDSKQLFPGTDDRKESSSPFFEDGIDFKHSFDLSGGTKQSQLSYPSSQGIHHEAAIALSTTLDPIQYSQRLERGDCVIIDGPGRDLEDFIDPETLLPYDQLDFGEDRCRVIYTVETDPPGTKRICGGSAFCPREGHCDNTPKERAKPAYYKTISTGAFVDGIIDSHSSQFNEPDDDDDENDTERFERSLSVLGTQLPTQDFSPKKHTEIIPPTQYYHGLSARATQNQHPDFAQTMMSTPLNGMFFSYQAQSSIDATIENESEVEGDDHETSITSEIMVDVQSLLKEDVAQSPTQIVDEFPESFPAFVTPHTIPPSRSELIAMENQSYLHLLESNEKPPSWLEHAVGYTQRKENSTQEQILTFSGSSTAGHYVQPVRIPPSRHEVEKWSKKNVRRSPEQIKHSSKRQKAESANEKTVQCRRQNDALEIDSNTRKIVPKVQKTKPAEEGIDSHLHGQHVEEVQWEPSQAWQLTMSQSTQHDQDNGRDVDPHAGTAYHPNTSSQRTLPELNEGSENDREGSLDTGSLSQSVSQNSEQPLDGIGNQGGRIHVHGGGGLKAKTRPSQAVAPTPGKTLDESSDNKIINSFLPAPISFMSIEIHIQCRTGASRLDSKKIPMAPDSTKDKICAVVFVHGRDPGGGESIDVLSRGCIFVPLETETIDRDIQVEMIRSSMPRASMGISAQLIVECVKDEKGLLLRLASIVRMKDPDMLLSWDTQGAGIGYLIERGVVIGADVKTGSISTVEPSRDAAGIDMVRLLGRSPHDKSERHFLTKTHIEKRSDATFEHANAKTDERNVAEEKQFRGSGLGSDWDERVGAGAAAASIVSFQKL